MDSTEERRAELERCPINCGKTDGGAGHSGQMVCGQMPCGQMPCGQKAGDQMVSGETGCDEKSHGETHRCAMRDVGTDCAGMDHGDTERCPIHLDEARPGETGCAETEHDQNEHCQMAHGGETHSESAHAQMDHPAAHQEEADAGEVDHGAMDHGEMGHAEAAVAPLRTPATAPIEPFFVSPEMERAREQARWEMGGARFWLIEADRLEWRSGEGEPIGLLEGQGWYGGDRHRLWVKVEAEALLDAPAGEEEFEEAEVQLLYGRPISPYFDLEVGLRQDVEPSPSRTFAVVGVHGLAPQWFELDLALFVSDDGDLSSRLEAEYEMLFTQQWMLHFRAEVELNGSAVPELGLGTGVTGAEIGARLSYGRRFAPYVGVEWEGAFGSTADLLRDEGEQTSALSALAGVSFWF